MHSCQLELFAVEADHRCLRLASLLPQVILLSNGKVSLQRPAPLHYWQRPTTGSVPSLVACAWHCTARQPCRLRVVLGMGQVLLPGPPGAMCCHPACPPQACCRRAGVLPRTGGGRAALLRGAGVPLPASPRRRRLPAGGDHALGPAGEGTLSGLRVSGVGAAS